MPDLYAASVDYGPKRSEPVAFFKMVQNKLHYAAHGHTAVINNTQKNTSKSSTRNSLDNRKYLLRREEIDLCKEFLHDYQGWKLSIICTGKS